MKKQPDVTAITRENLVSSFWKLYQNKRIEQITVKEITNIAGYNRSTFYEYFTDVYDVLNYLEDTIMSDLSKSLKVSLDDPFNPINVQKVANAYIEKGEYLSVLLGENGDPYFDKKLKAIFSPLIISSFSVNQSNIYSAYIIEFALSAIIGTLTFWHHNKNEISENEIVRLIRSMLAKGTLQELQKL